MKQVLQNISNGDTSLVDVPCPVNTGSNLLIATKNTVVSAGTERMLVNFGRASYINKARQQPDKVKEVFEENVKVLEKNGCTFKKIMGRRLPSITTIRGCFRD